MIYHLFDVLSEYVQPFVFHCGHTLGYRDSLTNSIQPLVPPFESEKLEEVAGLISIGESPLFTLKDSLDLGERFEGSRYCVILNDTTNFPNSNNQAGSINGLVRRKFRDQFKSTKGLPDSYMRLIESKNATRKFLAPKSEDNEIETVRRLFWTESELRNRFYKIVSHVGNLQTLEDIVSVRVEGARRLFDFHKLGQLSYCRLSRESDSLTGGPECVAEVVELCMEIFGCRSNVLNYLHKAVKHYRLRAGNDDCSVGTYVFFFPSICFEHVTAGLKIYSEFFSHQDFAWIAIPHTSDSYRNYVTSKQYHKRQ